MSLHIEDLPGLNRTPIRDMPIIGSQALAEAVLSGATGRSLSIAGLRHSQGGHTVRRGGRMLLTETLRHVDYYPETHTVIADAGASWSQIHHVLRPHRRAPLVQQSSAHFTVGGSIAVNCHGRAPAEGPVGNTVERLWVLCGDGNLRECSRTEEPQLFRAVIGGYGACGLIVRAELRTTEDIGLSEIWYRCNSLQTYMDRAFSKLPQRIDGSTAHLHFAWLCPVPGDDFLDEAVVVDYPPHQHGNVNEDPVARARCEPPRHENWGTSELMRAIWSAARFNDAARAQAWELLRQPPRPPVGEMLEFGGIRTIGQRVPADLRSNWLRRPVGFTITRGEAGPESEGRVDLLLEFFLPPGKAGDMASALRTAFRSGNPGGMRLLSCTLRRVAKDTVDTCLRYAPDVRLCMALELSVPVVGDGSGRRPADHTITAVRALIDKARALGGTHYLPYWRFATREQFEAAYGDGAAALRAAIDRYDPQRRFWNEFLEAYL